MKTKMIFLLIADLILMTPAMATTSSPGKGTGLSDRIRAEISYPSKAIHQQIEGMVLVGFTVDSNGTIHIEGVNASHQELRDYVVNVIQNIKVQPADKAYGKNYNMKFVFRLI